MAKGEQAVGWNLADVFEAVGGAVGDRTALLHGDRALSWAELDRRSNALARYLIAQGAKPGDKISLYSYNRPEYLEILVAAFKARLAPVNINYRYRAEELAYIFDNSDSVAVVFESVFAENLEALRDNLPKLKTFIQLNDPNSATASWAVPYEDAVAGDDSRLANQRDPGDLLLLYTGGTTGMPKGVMWRQEDIWFSLGGGGDVISGQGKPDDMAEHIENVKAGMASVRLLPACPLMHGTGLLTAISALFAGGSIVTLPGQTFDATSLWQQVEEKEVNVLAIVGDVFARPMLKALEQASYDLSSLRMIISSGVMFSPEIKTELLKHHPGMIIVDSLGSSEATGFGTSLSTAAETVQLGSFKIGDRVKVFTDDLHEVQPGSDEIGRVARSGNIPSGYYKDPDKTAQTFPTINGVRYSIPGDYARVKTDGTLVLLGRGSVCINTGGEKVFPEEIEETLKRHPSVEDAAVVGLPDDKWGQAVTALVTPSDGHSTNEEELREHVRGLLAGFKIPKRILSVESLGRSPAGKMDYKTITTRARAMLEQN
ncbi:MAG: acyl-CoA synthetase [Deltaproteobacteria bacterium]